MCCYNSPVFLKIDYLPFLTYLVPKLFQGICTISCRLWSNLQDPLEKWFLYSSTTTGFIQNYFFLNKVSGFHNEENRLVNQSDNCLNFLISLNRMENLRIISFRSAVFPLQYYVLFWLSLLRDVENLEVGP